MPWEPQDISNAVAFWLADDIAQANGSNVTAWTDRVNGLTTVSFGVAPTYNTAGVSSQPSVNFGGSGALEYAASNAVSTALSGSVFVVGQTGATPGSARAFWGSTNTQFVNSAWRLWGRYNSAGLLIEQDNGFSGGETLQGDNGPLFNTTDAFLTEWRSDSSAHYIALDGTDVPLSVLIGPNTGDWFGDTTNRGNFTIGGVKTSSSQGAFLGGHICVVLVIDGALSDTDRALLNQWFNDKYGIDIVGPYPDFVAPTVTIEQAVGQVDSTHISPITFTATFSEPVTGFTSTDVSFVGSTAGGTLVANVTGGPTVYTITVTGMTANGTVVASIPAGVAVDDWSNPNEASTSFDNIVTWQVSPPFAMRYQQGVNTLFAGSETEYGDTDGPALIARFDDLTDITTVYDGSQRPVIMNKNLFYVVDGTKLKMIHPCDMILPEPPEFYWLGYADGTQTITELETPGENIFFTENIVNTTTDGIVYELHRYYPDFLNYGTFLVSDSDDSYTYQIEVHLELTASATYFDILIGDASTNFATVDPGIYSGTVIFDWSDTWTTNPANNMLITVEPSFTGSGSVIIGAGSYMKVSEV